MKSTQDIVRDIQLKKVNEKRFLTEKSREMDPGKESYI